MRGSTYGRIHHTESATGTHLIGQQSDSRHDGQRGIPDRKRTQPSSLTKESLVEFLLLFILTENGFLPGGSGTTIRHNTQITHHVQTKHKHKTIQTIKDTLHTMNTILLLFL
jgi:hypothetical protein